MKTVGVNNTVVNCSVDNVVVDAGSWVRCRATRSPPRIAVTVWGKRELEHWHNCCFSEAHERRDRHSRRHPASGVRPALDAA